MGPQIQEVSIERKPEDHRPEENKMTVPDSGSEDGRKMGNHFKNFSKDIRAMTMEILIKKRHQEIYLTPTKKKRRESTILTIQF